MARSRSQATELARLFQAAALPVYALDDKGRILFCNRACADWLGLDDEQLQNLLGQRCEYHSSSETNGPPSLAASLCPPPEALAGTRVTAPISCPGERGELRWREAEFIPLSLDPLSCPGLLAIVSASDVILSESSDRSTDGDTPTWLHNRIRLLREKMAASYELDQLIGESPAIKRVRAQLELASTGQARIIVLGPPGSGRERVARTIHYSDKSQTAGPLVPLSCSLLDAELLQTTITAFVRGCAELETERPASLLLLEVDKLPIDAQGELAGFLNIPEFDLHVISTAAESLLEIAQRGEFRHDLAHAMSTLMIRLPALCEIKEDIPLLAQAFLESANSKGKRQLSGFTDEALDLLVAHSWPGNVDELNETITAAHKIAEGPFVDAPDLTKRIHQASRAAQHPRREDETIVLDEFLADIEKELFQRALSRTKGNKAGAARLLGISRARLHRRMGQLGLDKGYSNVDDTDVQ